MKLQLVRHLWGVDGKHGYTHYLPHWQEVGYRAVEVSLRRVQNQPAFRQFLGESRWPWIAQIFSNDFVPGGTVRTHLDSLRLQIEECLELQPWFFNAHSGSDTWTLAEAQQFYDQVVGLERELGVVIAHETHRLRWFGNPWQTYAILRQQPTLRLTCDFSHWVCVAERLLEDCGEILQLAAHHCHHVHARVGFEEGPQVSDPRAPEWARHLEAHERWWSQVWLAQSQRGLPVSTLTPEFGPAPYLQLLPFTQVPVTNLVEVCDWMARRQAGRFAADGFSPG
jgi:hypothetical protein